MWRLASRGILQSFIAPRPDVASSFATSIIERFVDADGDVRPPRRRLMRRSSAQPMLQDYIAEITYFAT
jgi:hypothetical protein